MPQLWGYLDAILTGLIEHKIFVISYASDGTQLEQSVQGVFISTSPYVHWFTITHPVKGHAALRFRIATYRSQPIIMIQDPKHALKTCRNNLFSGARLLTLGNCVATYEMARHLAFDTDSPLFNRDFEKLDRQDDNAALRLFSSSALRFLIEKHPEVTGLIIYLFVCGELVDAYQNRKIAHDERILMALRAYFFLEMWKTFLAKANYSKSRHFISHEAADILSILIEGLIGLIIVHRDHMDGRIFPLLPWLHATEVCEHVFGELRRIRTDFTFLDFMFLVPQIHVLLDAALTLPNGYNPKARASGYAHTWTDDAGVDLNILSIFPTDARISEMASIAHSQAENLWDALGVSPVDLNAPTSTVRLPGIDSWFSGPGPISLGFDTETDTEEEDKWSESDSASEVDETELLHRLIKEQETFGHDDRATTIKTAAISLAVDERLHM